MSCLILQALLPGLSLSLLDQQLHNLMLYKYFIRPRCTRIRRSTRIQDTVNNGFAADEIRPSPRVSSLYSIYSFADGLREVLRIIPPVTFDLQRSIDPQEL